MRPWSTSGRLLPGLTLRRLSTQGPAVQLLLKTTSAETADNVGIQKLKRLVMESIKEFPRGINSDQVISLTLADGCNGSVHPGPGLKLPGPRPISNANKGLIHRRQAPSVKPQALEASSDKRQAPSSKRQA